MNAEFYLFDVDHGQCAALRLPNGRWCIFDVGCTSSFSPVQWIVNRHASFPNALADGYMDNSQFRFLKGTVSHLHGDHLADYARLFRHSPEFLNTVDADEAYLEDCQETCSTLEAMAAVDNFVHEYRSNFSATSMAPDYGSAQICVSLPVAVARQIGGDANSRVNNASIITRIDVYGNSILLCGDMERESWEFLLGSEAVQELLRAVRSVDGRLWRHFVSNVDVLVAPHHGHKSGYSTDLVNLARPRVVLASVVSKDPHVDSRYSQGPVRGIRVGKTNYTLITTRKQGHIKVTISPPTAIGSAGARSWAFGNTALQ